MEGCAFVLVLSLCVGAAREQELRDLDEPRDGRDVQRRGAVEDAGLKGRAVLQEVAHGGDVFRVDGAVERCRPVAWLDYYRGCGALTAEVGHGERRGFRVSTLVI